MEMSGLEGNKFQHTTYVLRPLSDQLMFDRRSFDPSLAVTKVLQ
jgi:hypothetical protein